MALATAESDSPCVRRSLWSVGPVMGLAVVTKLSYHREMEGVKVSADLMHFETVQTLLNKPVATVASEIPLETLLAQVDGSTVRMLELWNLLTVSPLHAFLASDPHPRRPLGRGHCR